jgi:hypothetical protein
MKKFLLITAAAVIATSAAAEVTVGATLNYDLKRSSGASTTTGFSDTEITVKATEAISPGLSVTASLGLNGASREGTVTGSDATLGLSTPVGSLLVGQVEAANGLKANTFGLAPVMGADGIVLADASNVDIVKYSMPSIYGLTPSVSAVRGVGSTGKHSYILGTTAKVGVLNTKVDYTNTSKRIRASASLQVAGATVGAGWSGRETGVSDSWSVSTSIPVGAFDIGGAYSKGDGKALEVGAQYNLSKTTNVGLAYRKVEENTVAANNANTYRLRLSSSF